MTVPVGLVQAAVCAVLGAAVGRTVGPAGIVACAVLAVAPIGRFRGAIACALPAAIMAWSLPVDPQAWPATGPVTIDAEVQGPLRRDRPGDRAWCTLTAEPSRVGSELRCSISLPDGVAPDAILPGDRIRGPGFLETTAHRARGDSPPRVKTELTALEIESGGLTPRRVATALRLALEDELSARLSGDSGRLCCHLVLGDGPPLPDDLVAAHRATGLAHLLAVSGAHASMLAYLLGLAYRASRGRDPWSAHGYRRACGVILIVYGAVTGWEPPVFRALVAFLMASWAAAHGRRTSVAAALALPALLTAWLAPDDLARPSFWLSYAAVIGLSAAGAFGPGGPWHDVVRTALRASCWTLATTAPLALYWFGQLAPWTVLGTPLCAPLVAGMLGLGLITAAAGLVLPPLADALAPALQWMSDLYVTVVRGLALLPAAPIHAPFTPPLSVLIATVILGALPLALRPTRRRLLLACAVPCIPFFLPIGGNDERRVTLCDVGHGQACVVALGAAGTAVVDCGARIAGHRAARAVVDALPPRRTLDVLILSHADADHTSGVPELLSRIRVRRAVMPIHLRGSSTARALRRRGVETTWLRPGDSVRPLPGLTVRAPRIDASHASDNDASLWVRISCSGSTALLPGDAESRGIAHALAEGIASPADVLVLPHHGRGPAHANARLLSRVSPSLALCSHGDPHDAPLAEASRRAGATVLGTAARGRIDVSLDAGGVVTCEFPRRVGVGVSGR